jgi:hypothetical protein
LPFKCNLQRYTAGEAGAVAYTSSLSLPAGLYKLNPVDPYK